MSLVILFTKAGRQIPAAQRPAAPFTIHSRAGSTIWIRPHCWALAGLFLLLHLSLSLQIDVLMKPGWLVKLSPLPHPTPTPPPQLFSEFPLLFLKGAGLEHDRTPPPPSLPVLFPLPTLPLFLLLSPLFSPCGAQTLPNSQPFKPSQLIQTSKELMRSSASIAGPALRKTTTKCHTTILSFIGVTCRYKGWILPGHILFCRLTSPF